MKIVSKPALALMLFDLFLSSGDAAAVTGRPTAAVCDESAPLSYVEKIPPAQAEYLWKDTRVHPNGYLETVVPVAYLDLIKHLRAVSKSDAIEEQGPVKESEWRRTATLDETPHRKTTFFSDGFTEAMLTRWGYEADGARLCFFEAFLNVKVGNARGTISLAKSSLPNEKNALWKLTWVPTGESVQIEFYVRDRLNSVGEPSRSVREIVDLALQISAR